MKLLSNPVFLLFFKSGNAALFENVIREAFSSLADVLEKANALTDISWTRNSQNTDLDFQEEFQKKLIGGNMKSSKI